MKLETERTVLRNFSNEDLQDVFAYCKYKSVGDNAGWVAHKNKDDSKIVLDKWISNPNQLAIVDKESRNVIGHITINEDSEDGRDDTKELGFALHPDYQRKGIMSEVVAEVLDYLFHHNIECVWACCFKENIASKTLIEKIGFILQQEGQFYSSSLDKTFDSYEHCLTKSQWSEIRNRK